MYLTKIRPMSCPGRFDSTGKVNRNWKKNGMSFLTQYHSESGTTTQIVMTT